MKFYHFGLFFVIIAAGFFVTAQIRQLNVLQQEELRRNEYNSLVAAVNAAAEVAFVGAEQTVTEGSLEQVSEVFFQTLSVLHDGTPDGAGRGIWRECVPCLVVFEARGYYRYCFTEGRGYGWSELLPYNGEEIPECFYTETEAILERYHALHYTAKKQYRMKAAQKGIWEQSLSKACVFAVYAPRLPEALEEQGMLLYAAAGRTRETYYVTEDKYCHIPSCVCCKEVQIVAAYTSQKESAEDGAKPCELCLK